MKISLLIILSALLLIGGPRKMQAQSQTPADSLKQVVAKMQKRLKALEQKQQEDELKKLRQEAQAFVRVSKKETKQKTFKSGQRSLQAINPEISMTGDAVGLAVINKEGFNSRQRSGALFRVAGLHIQGNLDPFSLTKLAIGFHPDGIELGEAYVVWTNVLPNVSLMAGKFRQQFGVLNRWHAHSLDQFDFPLAMTTILGEEGLNQIGLSADVLLPALWADANSLTLQITNGQNDQLFAGKMFSFPVLLGHLKNYYDLNPETYLEIGLSAMAGPNNARGYNEQGARLMQPDRITKLAGADLTLFWEPLNRAHYHSFLWRSEFYYADREDSLQKQTRAWGAYSYIEYKMNERWNAGLRADYTQPFTQNNSSDYLYQLVPYLTWWQSHWVRWRLQYNMLNGNRFDKPDHIIRLQLTWAVGPHKHERY